MVVYDCFNHIINKNWLASGEHTKNRWKITIFFFCKSTIKSHIHMFDDVGPGYRSLHIHCDVDE